MKVITRILQTIAIISAMVWLVSVIWLIWSNFGFDATPFSLMWTSFLTLAISSGISIWTAYKAHI